MLIVNFRKSSSPRLHAQSCCHVNGWSATWWFFFFLIKWSVSVCCVLVPQVLLFVCADRCKLFLGADEAFCRKPTSLSSWEINLSDFLSPWLSLDMLHFLQQPQWHSSGPTHVRTQVRTHARVDTICKLNQGSAEVTDIVAIKGNQAVLKTRVLQMKWCQSCHLKPSKDGDLVTSSALGTVMATQFSV